jgi:hypothetical protein
MKGKSVRREALCLHGQSIEEWRDLDVVHENPYYGFGQRLCFLRLVAKEAKCHAEGYGCWA